MTYICYVLVWNHAAQSMFCAGDEEAIEHARHFNRYVRQPWRLIDVDGVRLVHDETLEDIEKLERERATAEVLGQYD